MFRWVLWDTVSGAIRQLVKTEEIPTIKNMDVNTSGHRIIWNTSIVPSMERISNRYK